MSVYLIKGETLTGIADAIREKTGETGTIDVPDMASKISDITGGGSAGSVSKLAQYAAGSLMEITAEDLNGVTTIPSLKFQYWQNLVSVEIPEGVESICSYCFMECGANLSVVTLPSTLKCIEDGCFSFCSGITDVRVKAKTPPTLGYGCFDMCPNAIFTVDAGCAATYRSATNWSAFADRTVEKEASGDTESWLFQDAVFTSYSRDDLPVPVADVSYTCFVDGEEIGTATAVTVSEGVDVSFNTEDYRVYFRYLSGTGWHFHPIDSQVQSGTVSIRINS